jgi:hypothetical protein
MKWSSYPSRSAVSATPSLNSAKNGLEKVAASAWGVSTPRVIVCGWVSRRATGFGR